MTNPEYREHAEQVFCDVLERMAFMFGESVDADELPQCSGTFYLTEMSFTGALEGTLSLAVPVEMCMEIAANVLGVDLDADFAQQESCDALKEVLNVTCGNLLTAIAGEEPIFDLEPPQVTELDEPGWLALLADDDAMTFDVDDNPALLLLKMK